MNVHETNSWKATAVGRAWQGFKAKYEHTFDHLPTTADIKATSGDFEYLGPVKVQCIHRVTCEEIFTVRVSEPKHLFHGENMNKTERKKVRGWMDTIEKLGPAFTELEAFRGKVEALGEEVSEIKDNLEELKDEQQGKYEEMSEKRKESDTASRMASDIAEMESAISSLDTMVDNLQEIVTKFDESQAAVDELVTTLNNVCDEEE